jgi:two-component system sensor histidine kinase TctE
MLRELSRNLLHNAIKYSPVDGALSVRLEVQEQFAQLTIRDSGQGISPELQERLFQPFSAGDIRTGSGLGLAICLEVVKALKGAITLTNRYENDKVIGKVLGLNTVVRLPLQNRRSSTSSADTS